jgi:hypothetical protein
MFSFLYWAISMVFGYIIIDQLVLPFLKHTTWYKEHASKDGLRDMFDDIIGESTDLSMFDGIISNNNPTPRVKRPRAPRGTSKSISKSKVAKAKKSNRQAPKNSTRPTRKKVSRNTVTPKKKSARRRS